MQYGHCLLLYASSILKAQYGVGILANDAFESAVVKEQIAQGTVRQWSQMWLYHIFCQLKEQNYGTQIARVAVF